MKSVSIVIPNWNGRGLLAEYFHSVVAAAEEFQERTNTVVEVIVVDDAGTDDSREWLQENYGGHELVKVIKLETNVGFLRAVNRGFETAKGTVVFLLNNDVQVEADCIAPLVEHFEDPDVFAVCCRAGRIDSGRLDGGGKVGRFERGFWRVFLNYEALANDAKTDLISFYGSGGYTMYDRAKWGALGGFQDCLAPIYWEDVEICYRAWKRGWTVIFEPNAHVSHQGSATMGKKPMKAEMAIVTERNRLLMTWINLHDPRMFASHLFWLALKLIGSVITLKWSYLRSFSRAVGKLSKVKAMRSIERREASITDRDLQLKFAAILNEPGVHLVATEADEIEFDKLRDSRNPERRSGR